MSTQRATEKLDFEIQKQKTEIQTQKSPEFGKNVQLPSFKLKSELINSGEQT